jgi:hypothetical protein
MDRETQSRLIEFLLTYGWALIVLLFAAGILIFFGLFPGGASFCDIDPNIECLKWSITSDGNITLIMKNNFDQDLREVKLCVGNCTKTFGTWKKGTILGGNFTKLTGCAVKGTVFNERINLTYKLDTYTARGQITGVVN